MRSELLSSNYDWEGHEGPTEPVRNPRERVEIDDETLRDGLQGPHLKRHPSIENKKFYLGVVAHAGYIDHADVAIPSKDPVQLNEAAELVRFTIESNLPISLSIAGRGGVLDDTPPIVALSQQFDGYPLEADIFLDPTHHRAKIEGWDRNEKIANLKTNIKLLKSHGLPVMFVPERSTTATPEELYEVCQIAADLGVDRICIADTKGIASETSVKNIFRWGFESIGSKYPDIKWDFHEHNDRGLGLGNCITASEEGVDRIHATMFGIGERTGNVNLHELIFNLNLKGLRKDDLKKLFEVANVASRLFEYPLPNTASIYGEDAFDQISGIHGNTGIKELKQNVPSDIYSVVPPAEIGRKPKFKVGPLSGRANAEYVLEELGLKADPAVVAHILAFAKSERRILTEDEIRDRATSFIDQLKSL